MDLKQCSPRIFHVLVLVLTFKSSSFFNMRPVPNSTNTSPNELQRNGFKTYWVYRKEAEHAFIDPHNWINPALPCYRLVVIAIILPHKHMTGWLQVRPLIRAVGKDTGWLQTWCVLRQGTRGSRCFIPSWGRNNEVELMLLAGCHRAASCIYI